MVFGDDPFKKQSFMACVTVFKKKKNWELQTAAACRCCPSETWDGAEYLTAKWFNNWLVVSTPLKNMLVSWDYEIPKIWENEIHVPNHQPDKLTCCSSQSYSWDL